MLDETERVSALQDIGLGQILSPHASVLGIVSQKIRKFASLLDQVEPRKAGHLVLEAGNTQQLAQRDTGIVETERLVEITCQQIMLHCI